MELIANFRRRCVSSISRKEGDSDWCYFDNTKFFHKKRFFKILLPKNSCEFDEDKILERIVSVV